MGQLWGHDIIGRSVDELDTPALLLNLDRLKANVAEMAEFARHRGISLRPHAKTHKSPLIARLQMEKGAEGITVATLGEAEVLAATGINDIFIAFPVIGGPKIARLLELARKVRVSTIVDDAAAARALSSAFAAGGRRLPVLIKVDVGLGRCGVPPGPRLLDLAREVSPLPGLELEGIAAHAGHVYGARTEGERRTIGRDEGEVMVKAAVELRRAGIPAATVSVGSTPTALISGEVPGVTEIRPGNYVFYDMMQVALGVVTEERCALTVRAGVVSRPSPRRAIIDIGSKGLGLDTGGHGTDILRGYGRIIGHPDVVIERLSEEHGFLDVPADTALSVGDTVEVIPNHACVVANNFNEYVATRQGMVEGVWPVGARGYLR